VGWGLGRRGEILQFIRKKCIYAKSKDASNT